MLKKLFRVGLILGLLFVLVVIVEALRSNYDAGRNKSMILPDAVASTIDSCVYVTNITQGWQGSAFAIAPDILVTARHIAEGGGEFLITTTENKKYRAYQAISSKKYDIGFIKLDVPVLKPALVGRLNDLRLGETVYVIGGSMGKKHWPNVTAGIISNLKLEVESFGVPKNYGWNILWQVDAATYGGNSGSPIFTLDGVVRGILVGGPPGAECLSYCVPLEVAVPDLAVIRLLFIRDEYKVESAPARPQTWEEPLQEVFAEWPRSK